MSSEMINKLRNMSLFNKYMKRLKDEDPEQALEIENILKELGHDS